MTVPSATTPIPPAREAVMRARARELEGAFLAEMLGHAGLGESSGDFSGGNGAAQFASFLRQEQAQAVVAKGGIGLAETLFQAMARAESHER